MAINPHSPISDSHGLIFSKIVILGLLDISVAYALDNLAIRTGPREFPYVFNQMSYIVGAKDCLSRLGETWLAMIMRNIEDLLDRFRWYAQFFMNPHTDVVKQAIGRSSGTLLQYVAMRWKPIDLSLKPVQLCLAKSSVVDPFIVGVSHFCCASFVAPSCDEFF